MMTSRERNEAAFRRMKPDIDGNYPPGRFIAIDEGQIVGDAATLDELIEELISQQRDPRQTFVVQAGVDYPESATIL